MGDAPDMGGTPGMGGTPVAAHAPRQINALPVALIWLCIVAYALVFSWLTLTRYAAFEARALDMGNLNQAIWNTAHGNWFHLTNQPGTVNRLSLHVEPILLPIAALYRLYLVFVPAAGQINAGPNFLVVLQSVVVALGAWPVFWLARRLLHNSWAALAFGAAFLLNPSIQAANWLEFHPVTLAPTFLLAAFAALLARRAGWFALFAVLAATCKEEIGLLVFMQGAYALLFVPGMRRVGIITMVLAMGWSLTAVLGFQQFFADGNIHWGRYDYLGDSPLDMVWSLLTRPRLIWEQLQQAQALRYVHELWAPVGYLPLFAPHVFLLALPSLGINLLADFPPMHQVNTLIYAAPVMPFAVLAAILGAARIQAWSVRATRQRREIGSLVAGILGVVILGAALIQHHYHGYLPTGGNYRLYRVTDHHRAAAQILAQIPPHASVSAQDKLNPHVSGRETVYIFPRIGEAPGDEPAEMIWVDVTGPAWPQHPSDLHATIQTLLAGEYGVVAGVDGHLLLARGAEDRSLPPEFYTAWHAPASTNEDAAWLPGPVEFVDAAGNGLRLVNAQVTADAHGELVTLLDWQPIGDTSGNGEVADRQFGFYVAYEDAEGRILYDTEFYPPVAQLWYPTHRWASDAVSDPVSDSGGRSTGRIYRVQTLPWTLAESAFGLYVGVYEIMDSGAPGEFLPIVQAPPHLPRFAADTRIRLGGFIRQSAGDWAHMADMDSGPALMPVASRFGEWIELEAAAFTVETAQGRTVGRTESPGAVELTLQWTARAPVPADYTVFVHVLDAADNRLAQLDDMPRDGIGPRPMTSWSIDEPIVDRRRLELSAPGQGELRVQIGVYHWSDGVRLPVTQAPAQSGDVVPRDGEPGDVVELRPTQP